MTVTKLELIQVIKDFGTVKTVDGTKVGRDWMVEVFSILHYNIKGFLHYNMFLSLLSFLLPLSNLILRKKENLRVLKTGTRPIGEPMYFFPSYLITMTNHQG